MKPKLTLFDLDHTLLHGDSDQLWCEFLMDRGVLPREAFDARNREMARDYALGLASAQAFCDFYIGTLAGRSAADWLVWRDEYFVQRVAPRISDAAHALVARHRDAGDRVVLTTATCRFLSEPSAAHIGIGELIATECELDAQGRFSGRSRGTLNMREGKVTRLHEWLGARRLALADFETTLYSDSINDLPLLDAVDHPVAVDPDVRLTEAARRRSWQVVSLR